MRRRRVNHIGGLRKSYTRKPRRTYGKQAKYIIVCIAIAVTNIGSVIAKAASLFEVVTFSLFVLGPVLYKSFKYDRDPMSMLPGALLRTGIWLGMFLSTASLSAQNEVFKKIFLWPAA